MSELRLVRCPKCDKVLPEPSGYTVYQCGGCGAILRAKSKSLAVDNLFKEAVQKKSEVSICDTETSVRQGKSVVVDNLFKEAVEKKSDVTSSSSICDTETSVKQGDLDMDIKSPARPMTGGYNGSKSPLRDNNLDEFHKGLPKSPIRTSTPLRDFSRSPMRETGGSDDFGPDEIRSSARSRHVSKSPVRGRGETVASVRTIYGSRSPLRDGMGGVGKSPRRPMRETGGSDDFDPDETRFSARSRHVSKSPVRGQGETVASVRTIYDSSSPIRDGMGGVGNSPRRPTMSPIRDGMGGVGKSPRRPTMSPLRQGIGSEVEENVRQDSVKNMTTKASFNAWLPDENCEGQSGDNYISPKRRTWRDRAEDRPEQIDEGVELVLSDEHEMTSKGSFGDPTHEIDSHSEGDMYRNGRFRSDYDGGYDRPIVFDGRSKHSPDSIYDYGSPRQSVENARAQALQLERVELLRKYEELKDQLNGLGDAGVSVPGCYGKYEEFPLAEFPRKKRGSVQQFLQDRNIQRPSQFMYDPGLAHRMEDMYEYNDRSAGQMIRGPQSNLYYSNHKIHGHVPGRSLDFDQLGFKSHASDTHGHHPTCGCLLCYPNDRHDNLTADLISHYSMEHERHGQRGYDPRMAHTAPRRRSSHLPLHHHPKRGNISNLNKRLCRPISGGAPFVLCISCFQLLKLPGKFTAKRKNQQLQCGACSTVISFDLQLKSLDSLHSQKKPDSVPDDGGGGNSSEVTMQSGPKHRRRRAATTTTIGSYDFDTISEASKSSKGHKLSTSLAEVPFTADDNLSDKESVGSRLHNFSEKPTKIRPAPGSSLQEHLDYSCSFHISEDAVKHIIEKKISPVAPLGVNDAIETEVPSMLPTTRPQDSEDIPRKSSIDALEESSGRGSPGKTDVYVNGQAISQRAVKKAEKLAGKIHPGEYWYDPKAGFWGVMGHRCLGIIPPSIKEFSAPMPENCSRGDSSVYVNGRELLKTDLDLIARRGLPTSTDRRYVVDISGRVLDEETRDFVVNLGRLAPSVERNKCGFGMHVPKQLNV